ncbi:MAG: hypothetical protein DRQ55_00630 [Planctomycetota bacterium]|nr:MAG: hypothetical protein DRQ55_00630 [Planctomycetota bacterium]
MLLALLPWSLVACGRLSGSGGGSSVQVQAGVTLPPLNPAPPPSAATVVSLVPAADRLAVRWVAQDDTLILGLFVAAPGEPLYEREPLLSPLEGNGLIVTGFSPGDELRVGLGLGQDDGDWLPAGAVLSARLAPPVFVDIAAADGGDGSSPARAYNGLFPALIDSLLMGGANLWVAEGIYPPGAYPMFPLSAVYGGFAPGFELATRDPELHLTVLQGVPGQPVAAASGAGLVILDGLVLDGRGVASSGLQGLDAPLEVRMCAMVGAAGPGLRWKGVPFVAPVPVVVLGSLSVGNGAEGFSANGSFDLDVRACRFDSNVQEGLDIDDLRVGAAHVGHVVICDSRFAGNGTEGLDLDMAPTLTVGIGRFEVTLKGNRFERNGAAGCLVDVDFDAASGGRATLLLEGLVCRENLGHGLQLDLDGPSQANLSTLLAHGNGGDGLSLTSADADVLLTAADCALTANGGAGARASEGRGALLLSGALLAGNAQAGLLGEGASKVMAVSTHGWLQVSAWEQGNAHRSLALEEASAPALARLPLLYTRVTDWSPDTPELLTVQEEPDGSGPLELSDDGVARALVGLGAVGEILVAPAPTSVVPPAVLSAFAPGAGVVEDYRALPGGLADDTGMAAPGGPSVDIAPVRRPGSVGAPGRTPPPFFLASLTPPLPDGLGPGETLMLGFSGGEPDPASVHAASVVVRTSADGVLATSAFVQAGQVHIAPPAGGWPSGALVLELHRELRSLDGLPLDAPVALPLDPEPQP